MTDNEITADSIAERSQDTVRDERLQRATSLIGQIEAQVEGRRGLTLLGGPGGRGGATTAGAFVAAPSTASPTPTSPPAPP